MGDFHVKKIILPSGKAVEIVYFNSEPGVMEATPDEPLNTVALDMCPDCTSEFVQPTEWFELDPGRWQIDRLCPNCGWESSDVHSEAEVEQYDIALSDGADQMVETLDELQHENMEREIEEFVTALEAGHIQPMDF